MNNDDKDKSITRKLLLSKQTIEFPAYRQNEKVSSCRGQVYNLESNDWVALVYDELIKKLGKKVLPPVSKNVPLGKDVGRVDVKATKL